MMDRLAGFLPGPRGAGLCPRRRGERPQLPRLPGRARPRPRSLRGEEDPHLPPPGRHQHLPRALRRAGPRAPRPGGDREARSARRRQAGLQARSQGRALPPPRGQRALQPVEPPRRGGGGQPPPPRLPRSPRDPDGAGALRRGQTCAGSPSPTTRAPSSGRWPRPASSRSRPGSRRSGGRWSTTSSPGTTPGPGRQHGAGGPAERRGTGGRCAP